jgi:anti-sigma factor RsiW
MIHLDDYTLNEYLDGALDEPARLAVEAHLAVCAECRQTHSALQRVFGLLAALPEKPLTADLRAAPPIIVPNWLRPLAWLQVVAAAALLAVVWPGRLTEFAAGWRWLAASGSAWLGMLLLQLAQLSAARMAAVQHAMAQLSAWQQWAGPSAPGPASAWALLAGVALAAWCVSLRLLFRNGSPHSSEGGPHHGTDH